MGKTLLVLGGSSDIALAYLRACNARYDTIVAQYCSHKEELEKLGKESEADLLPVRADLSDPDSVQDLLAFLREQKIAPDYVLHCPAGKTALARVEQFDRTALQRELEIEVFSILEIMKELAAHMQEQQFGRICFVLSSVTESPVAYQTTYNVAKHALLGAMKSLAVDLAGKKITVNAISPSRVDTKFNEGASPFVIKQAMAGTPLRRLAVPEDLVGAIALFLSDENEYVTGENLLIAGGGILR